MGEFTGKFTKVAADAFKKMQINAGVILNNFNVEKPNDVEDADIICSTSGGVNATCVPTFKDLADDVDNVPANMIEYKQASSWECKLSFATPEVSVETIALSLGIVDVNGKKITPRMSVKPTDAKDVWWVGERNDGGYAAICLKNAIGTGGLNLQTTNEEKSKLSIELTGHYSIAKQKEIPMIFYASEEEEETPAG